MIRYLPFKERLYSKDLGRYISFGIKIVDGENNILMSVSDVSVYESVVKSICQECTDGDLDPRHLIDVIQDNI